MKIFIVEDDRVLQLMLKKMLDRLGHIISGTAVEGSEAIKKIRDASPDLVLMDIQLKDEINGIQVIETLKKENDIKVIYITGNSDNKFREKASRYGYVDYLIKPISVDILKESISKAE
ncbi:response regulator [Rhodohalobacter sp.]|uniref:response regulator n=1 Tax=Rhodohalobacter sp. TaxID=1974210 RepID=UPI002ACE6768|nr:response regulator [Rhodohalobacter sp.]MDZ7757359.1 response regulator [Rhodohalobacter sp.]